MDGAATERIGVLFVHGIGEQKRFEHLEAEARQLAIAFGNRDDVIDVGIHVRRVEHAAYGAEHPTWNGEEGAPITLHVARRAAPALRVEIREVWWADLDDPPSIRGHLRFWFWVFSMWAIRPFRFEDLGDGYRAAFGEWMRSCVPDGYRIPARARWRLYGVGSVFALALGLLLTVRLLPPVIRRLCPPAEMLASYLGDVRLYQAPKRDGKGAIDDLGLAPRFSIRRRMVQGLVRMAVSGYDRWYVMAHSLGTVVAYNGLMDPGPRMPSYLTPELVRACRENDLTTPLNAADLAKVGTLHPLRHPDVDDDLGIDRGRLFAKFSGLLTYGSPLEIFADLWPATVSISEDRGAFGASVSSRWINIVDSTDPVARPIRTFPGLRDGETKDVENVFYKAPSVHLGSHVNYFARPGEGRLVDRVAEWLGNPAAAFTGDDPVVWSQSTTMHHGREALRVALWWAAAAALMIVLAIALRYGQAIVAAMIQRPGIAHPWIWGLRTSLLVGLVGAPGAALAAGLIRKVRRLL